MGVEAVEPQATGREVPEAGDAVDREQRVNVVGEPGGRATPRLRVLDHEEHPAVGAERNDFRCHERRRRRVHRREIEPAEEDARQLMGEPTDRVQVRAEGEEVVDRLGQRLTPQVVDDVVDRSEAFVLREAGGAALGRRDPSLPVDHARDLPLLRHVVELVPREVLGIVARLGARRQREHAVLHRLGHGGNVDRIRPYVDAVYSFQRRNRAAGSRGVTAKSVPLV